MSDAKTISSEPLADRNNRYISWKAWRIEESDDMISVRCLNRSPFFIAPVSVIPIVAFLIGWLHFSNELRVFLVIVGVIWFLAVIAVFVADRFFAKAGDWMLYDKKKEIIRLPRIGMEFDKSKLMLFQVIIGRPVFARRWWTEVNVVEKRNEYGGYKRHALMRAVHPRMVMPLVKEISEKVDCTVETITHSTFGKHVKHEAACEKSKGYC